MSYQRQPVDQQPTDESSGRYPVDQFTDTDLDLPEISEERVQSILAWGVLVLSIAVAFCLPIIVLLDWLKR